MNMHEREKRDCVCWLMGRVENGLEGDLHRESSKKTKER